MTGGQPRSNVAVISVACMLATWGISQASAQSNLRERLAEAVETVEGACAADISNFCGKVTRGEGRLLSCMQAHDEQLSRRCQFALYRVSRRLEGSLNRVERISEACGSDIDAHCADADRIGQCVVEKRSSLSQGCQTVVATLRKAVQGLAALRGLPVQSSETASAEASRVPSLRNIENHVAVTSCFCPQRNAYEPRHIPSKPSTVLRYARR